MLFICTRQFKFFFPDVTDEMLQLVEQLGVFCYDYNDRFERHAETELPPRAQFFCRLAGEECSKADYARALRVWKDFNIENMGAYMLLYLLCDVALLADVFQRFLSELDRRVPARSGVLPERA